MHGATALVASQFAIFPIQIGISLYFIRRRIGFSWWEFLGALRKSAIITLTTLVGPLLIVLAAGNGGFRIGLPAAVAAGIAGLAGWIGGIHLSGHLLRTELHLLVSALRRVGRLRPSKGL